MIYKINFLKITSSYLFFLMILSFPAGVCNASSMNNGIKILNTKNSGKLSMIAMLSVMGLIVRYLNNKDKETAINIKNKFGTPCHVLELQKGFDIWRLEIHTNWIFIFRNEILYKSIELSDFPSEH